MKRRGRSPVLSVTPHSSSSSLNIMAHRSAKELSSFSPHPHGSRGSVGGGDGLAVPQGGSFYRTPSETGSESLADGPSLSPAHRLNTAESNEVGNASDQSGLGNSIFYDDLDSDASYNLSHAADPELTQKAITNVQSKIEKTKDLIKSEQTTRDDNVNEYLKLSSNANRQQQARIKQVFEKKNQKSAQNIQIYQKKLEDYQKKMSELQEHGIRPKHAHKLGQGLKHVGGNIRDGISGMSNTVMAKPKEFAHLLRHKFGSADNLSAISKDSDSDKRENRSQHGSASLPRENSGGGFSGGGGGSSSAGGGRGGRRSIDSHKRKCISDDGRRSEPSISIATTPSEADQEAAANEAPIGGVSPQRGGVTAETGEMEPGEAHTSSEWKAVMQEVMLHKEETDHLREEIDDLRQHFNMQIESLTDQLRDERDRSERLEEMINDMTELHQHEIENIKSGVNDMEEKVQYQSEERLLDIKEHLQSLDTKVTSMEHQAAQQQYLHIEGLDSTDARAVMMKLLTAVITVIHIILFIMGTVMNLARPFLSSSGRALFSLTVVLLSCYAYYRQDLLITVYHSFRPSNSSSGASM